MSKAKRIKGQAITEFVLVFPLFLLATMGIMELLLIYNARFALNTAVYLSTREIAASNGITHNKARFIAAVTAVKTIRRRLVANMMIPGPVSVNIRELPTKRPHGIKTYSEPVRVVKVKLTYFYKPLLPLFAELFPGKMVTLEAACRMPLEYPYVVPS